MDVATAHARRGNGEPRVHPKDHHKGPGQPTAVFARPFSTLTTDQVIALIQPKE